MSPSTLGLALGGGAVLGAAHIGVLQAIEETGLEVTHVAGTSMGALVATLFASGLSVGAIEALAGDLRWPDVTGFIPSRLGLFSMDRLESTLRRLIGDARMEAVEIPIALVAADIATGEKIVLTHGDLATAATASACVPGLFIPVEREGRLLVDGGLLENLPVSPLQRWEVDRIVAVDVHMGRRFFRPRNLPEVLSNALDMALAGAARERAGDADVLITPDTTSWSRAEMQDIPALVKEGYRSAIEVLGSLVGG